MKFDQISPTIDYRKNLILHALLKIEEWCNLTRAASWPLHQKVQAMLTDHEKLAETVNSVAAYYLEYEPIVPFSIVDLVLDELERHPIIYDEILQILNKKIGDALRLQP